MVTIGKNLLSSNQGQSRYHCFDGISKVIVKSFEPLPQANNKFILPNILKCCY